MIKRIASSIFFIGIGIASTIIYQIFFKPADKPIVEIKEKSKIVTKYVYRDYKALPQNELMAELKKYDTEEFIIDGEMVGDNVFRGYAKLHRRTARRDFSLKVNQTTNYRYYIIAGFAGIIIGGYTVYKIRK